MPPPSLPRFRRSSLLRYACTCSDQPPAHRGRLADPGSDDPVPPDQAGTDPQALTLAAEKGSSEDALLLPGNSSAIRVSPRHYAVLPVTYHLSVSPRQLNIGIRSTNPIL